MKAAIVRSFGQSDVFEVKDIDKPKVKSGHVLIKVAAASVNTVDTMIRQMGSALGPLTPELPAVLGMDFAGTIEAIGGDVCDYQVGDKVYGCAGGLADLQGALSEYLVADVRLIARKPNNLTMKEAAAIPLVGITAYEGLERAGTQEGQSVLIQGGAGGVGHIAVQIARYMGADVYATGSGEKQLSLIENLGATAIDYRISSVADYVERYTDGSGFDVVFDSVGGANMANSFEAAALNGHVASTVAMVELDLTNAHFKGLSLHVVFMLIPMLHDFRREAHSRILTHLTEIIEAGELHPVVDEQRFSLEQVGKAHDRLSSGHALGKVVVEVE